MATEIVRPRSTPARRTRPATVLHATWLPRPVEKRGSRWRPDLWRPWVWVPLLLAPSALLIGLPLLLLFGC